MADHPSSPLSSVPLRVRGDGPVQRLTDSTVSERSRVRPCKSWFALLKMYRGRHWTREEDVKVRGLLSLFLQILGQTAFADES